eukprot:CAMPEP_0181226444 /NCGR_PEP_ID=MMETSP1096-20121128/32261_1 /TAXON_ID=156174 ORGANISM="Chrysochromulina ericina, Strain CCMP281" /NCGR_SAMPLE_ID=MMETSP1096 /ASSEMBLY_ACC=CAM_ASM_000453 /LENGTH=71 /DNA_ID=CAMNT_0023319789 /DNA_START=374 /DNA_END=590 /DNA_ORIENTATION=+
MSGAAADQPQEEWEADAGWIETKAPPPSPSARWAPLVPAATSELRPGWDPVGTPREVAISLGRLEAARGRV